MSQIEFIARVCHEVNRTYCVSIGDNSLLPWDETSESIKQSAIKGVEFALANPDVTPEMQHDAWLKTKVEQGYTYGNVKDDVAKTHPCIVPYKELPQYQKFKDQLFITVVKAMT